jgi:hypothetical protein
MIPEKAFRNVLVLGDGCPVQELDYLELESKVSIRIQETEALWTSESCAHCDAKAGGGHDHAPPSALHSRMSIPAASTIVMAICTAKLAVAQTPGQSLGNSAALEERGRQLEDQPYTIKMGDFKLLGVPSLALQWNDNINLSRDHALDDYILSPQLRLDGSYPFTHRNVIRFSIGVGYDAYLQHNAYSGVRLLSGSEISFDLYIKDFWINVHNRFKYTRDTAGQPDVANTGLYGGFNNTAGLSGTWDLEDVVLTLGYDHLNFISDSSQFDYTDSATEAVSAQAGCRLNPRLTAGAEGSVAFTKYDQRVLNNNVGYNAGLYLDWRPGSYFEVKPRGGYTFYDFSQTSLVVPAVDQDAWYVDLELTHNLTDAFSYSLSGGHELRLGIQSDVVKAWYVRPHIGWRFIRDWSLGASFSYENGKQAESNLPGLSGEHYEWAGFDLGLVHNLTSKLSLGVNYRLTVRSSNFALREYTQNLVGLGLTYQLK